MARGLRTRTACADEEDKTGRVFYFKLFCLSGFDPRTQSAYEVRGPYLQSRLEQFRQLVPDERPVADLVLDEVEQHAADGLLGARPPVDAALVEDLVRLRLDEGDRLRVRLVEAV